MGYFPVRYDSRVVIYERKLFIRLATGANSISLNTTALNIGRNLPSLIIGYAQNYH